MSFGVGEPATNYTLVIDTGRPLVSANPGY